MKITVKIYQKIVFIFLMGLSTHVVSYAKFSKMPLAKLRILHAKSQQSKLLALDQPLPLKKSLPSDLLTAYLLLFKTMKLSNMVPLFLLKNTKKRYKNVASFQVSNNYIVVTPRFYEQSLSIQIFTLLHELRHAQQVYGSFADKRDVQLNNLYTIERDAEIFAATAIQCPDCLRCNQVAACSSLARKGYFGYNNYKQYIQQARKYCLAHATYNAKFNAALKDKNLDQVIALDNSMGTLVSRVSEKNVKKN